MCDLDRFSQSQSQMKFDSILCTHVMCINTVLEFTRIISKFQDASSGAHKLHELKNWSRELQNPFSPAA